MRHQRDVVSSARRRARPRSFTSLASWRMDFCVIARPSPRASEARASSSVKRNSARCRSRSSHKASASRTASCSEWNRPLSIARRAKAFWSGVSSTSIIFRLRETVLWFNHRPHLAYPVHRSVRLARPPASDPLTWEFRGSVRACHAPPHRAIDQHRGHNVQEAHHPEHRRIAEGIHNPAHDGSG